ncbi:1547_t:CDS:2 [Acaulospora colombiana]|uniref:1547_t:CDS:1 n=1 Tax=Acaulospora colombiana TaxID=27376 RepID=A0ACA9LR65_9GLOM|nr:1547_t:CDS:2 [Acaulospora colombiana]
MSNELEKSNKKKSKESKSNKLKSIPDQRTERFEDDKKGESETSKSKDAREGEKPGNHGKDKKLKTKKAKSDSSKKRKLGESEGPSKIEGEEKNETEPPIKITKKSKKKKSVKDKDGQIGPEVTQTKVKAEYPPEVELSFDKTPQDTKSYVRSTVSSKTPPVAAEENRQTPFRKVNAEMLIDLPPKAFEDFDKGVYTYMNALVMQYVDELDGIVLAYENVQLCDKSGYIYEDSPYSHFFVRADFILWDASKGCRMVGKVIRQSPLHIALLLYESFNVKINRQSIPNDIFEWRDDDHFYNAIFSDEQLELDKLYQDGQWYDKRSGEGITDCWMEFEAVGSEIDEGIIFVLGSLQYYSESPVQDELDALNQIQFDKSVLDLTIEIEEEANESSPSSDEDANSSNSSSSGDSSHPYDG